MSTLGFSLPDDIVVANMDLDANPFRFLLALTYRFNALCGGWIQTNLAIHLACSITVASIAGALGYSRRACLAAAGIFLLCPLAADAVWSVAGRSSMLCALFMLVGLRAALATRWRWCMAAFALAMLSKEEAIVFPIMLAAMLVGRARLAGLLVVVAPFALAVGAILPDHVGLLGHLPRYFTAIGHFVTFDTTTDPHWGVDALLVVGLAVAGALAFLWVRKPSVPLAMILFSPLAAYAAAPIADPFLEHRAYFALAGAALFIAQFRPPQLVALGFFVPLSVAQFGVYRTPVAAGERAVTRAPDAYRPHVNLAGAYNAVGRFPEALRHSRRAYELDQNDRTRSNLAFDLVNNGRMGEAMKVLHGDN